MRVLSYFADLTVAGFLLLALAGFGKRLLSLAGFSFPVRYFSFSMGLAVGLAAFSYALMAMGCVGLIRTLPVAGLILVFFCVGFFEIKEWAEQVVRFARNFERPRMDLFLLAVVSIFLTCVAANAIKNNTPPVSADELIYHMPNAKAVAESGYWRPPAFDHSIAYFANSVELIYSALLILRRDIAPKAMNFLIVFAMLGVIFHLAKSLAGWKAAVLACCFFYTSPRLASLIHIAYIDFVITFAAINAYAAYFLWKKERFDDMWIFLCIFFCSYIIASKYMLTVWIAFAVLCLVDFKRHRLPFGKLVPIMAFAAIAPCVLMIPRFLFNFHFKGNPFYPYSFLGFKGDELVASGIGGGGNPLFSILRNILNYLGALPWVPHQFLTFDFSQGSGPLLLLFPLLFLFSCARSEEAWDMVLVAAGIVVLTILIIPAGGPYRYCLVSHTLFAVVSGAGVRQFLKHANKAAALGLSALVIFSMLVPNALYAWGGALQRLPYLTGKQSDEDFVRRHYDFMEGYDTVEFCNGLPAGSRILVICPPWFAPYYYKGDLVFLNSVALFSAADFGRISSYLRENGISHVFLMKESVYTLGADQKTWIYSGKDFPELNIRWISEGLDSGALETLFDNGKAMVMEVQPK